MNSYTKLLDKIWVKTVQRYNRIMPEARRTIAEDFAREKFINMALPCEEKYWTLAKTWKIKTTAELIIAARVAWVSETKIFNKYAMA